MTMTLQCPQCGSLIEIPTDAFSAERCGPWNMVECGDCEQIVAFDQEDYAVRRRSLHGRLGLSSVLRSPPARRKTAGFFNRIRMTQRHQRVQFRKHPKRPATALPYVSRGRLLSQGEMAFFRALRAAVGKEYLISFKVRAADLISCGKKSWEDGFGYMIARHHLDFTLCEPYSSDIMAAIELDDRSHDRPGRRRRDEFLDRAFAAASIPLIRFRTAARYDAPAIGASIAGVFNGSSKLGGHPRLP